MCEHGCGYRHIEHEYIPWHHYHMHEHHEHRQPLTKEKELEVLEDWKKGMQTELTRIEQKIEKIKKEA